MVSENLVTIYLDLDIFITLTNAVITLNEKNSFFVKMSHKKNKKTSVTFEPLCSMKVVLVKHQN